MDMFEEIGVVIMRRREDVRQASLVQDAVAYDLGSAFKTKADITMSRDR